MSLTADFNQMNVLPHLKPREKYVNLQAVSSLQRRRRSGGKKKKEKIEKKNHPYAQNSLRVGTELEEAQV